MKKYVYIVRALPISADMPHIFALVVYKHIFMNDICANKDFSELTSECSTHGMVFYYKAYNPIIH